MRHGITEPGILEPGITKPATPRPALSIVIPARNEAQHIVASLQPLQGYRPQVEIILVDGGSSDNTAALASPLCDRVLPSPPGRARQMNLGASAARADALLFLHADTQLPPGFVHRVQNSLTAGHRWGRFDVRLEPGSPLLRLIAWMMNQRSRLTGVCTGDQGIFVQRQLFAELGGYADLPLMEDIELSKRLRRHGRPACLQPALCTSSRRWQQHGTLRTVVLMWWLRALYWLGVSPHRLAKWY